MIEEDSDESKVYAENGRLYVVPYNSPWEWKNDGTVRYTDKIIDVLFEHYNLYDDTPIVSLRMSMGGMSSIDLVDEKGHCDLSDEKIVVYAVLHKQHNKCLYKERLLKF